MTTPAIPKVALLSDLISDFVADTDAAADARANNRPRGIVTCFKRLDETLGGYLAPGLHVVQAAPGAGKTAFALQLAARCGFPALYVSAEMGLLELFRRTVARETKTFLGKLKSGEISGAEATKLALQTAEKAPHLALMDATRSFAKSDHIQQTADSLRTRAKAAHILIVIDSLQDWARSAVDEDGKPLGASEYDLINSGLAAAARIGAHLACPVLVVAHRNRQSNKSDGGLHGAKGSGDFEYKSETVIDLNRKDDMPDSNGEVEVKASIHKNRHGTPGGTFSFRFTGRTQEFREA
jgi:replicative DNA helicase